MPDERWLKIGYQLVELKMNERIQKMATIGIGSVVVKISYIFLSRKKPLMRN